jgi:hypothetical protein
MAGAFVQVAATDADADADAAEEYDEIESNWRVAGEFSAGRKAWWGQAAAFSWT